MIELIFDVTCGVAVKSYYADNVSRVPGVNLGEVI